MLNTRARDCPRCGKPCRPAAGLYRCQTCGGFDPDRHGRPTPAPATKPAPWPERMSAADEHHSRPIDGRPIAIDRKVRK